MPRIRARRGVIVLNRSAGGDVIINIIIALVAIFIALPFYYSIIQSIKPLNELFMYPPRFYVVQPTFRNFVDLFNLLGTSWVPFSRYIFNTVFITVVGTFGAVVFASMAAYALSKIDFPGRKWIFIVMQYSLMFNAVVAGIANFLTISAFHWMDTYWAILVPAFVSVLGMYLMRQYIDAFIPDAILEAARIDGASELSVFFRIAMPMVKPAWLTAIIFSFQGFWAMGSTVFIQSEQLKTLAYAMSQIIAGGVVRQGAGAASTVVMMIVPLIVFIFSQSSIIETMTTSGMKD